MPKNADSLDDQTLKELASQISFEDFEKEYGITEVSLKAGRHGYPPSEYYRLKTEDQLRAKHRRVERFLNRLSKRARRGVAYG